MDMWTYIRNEYIDDKVRVVYVADEMMEIRREDITLKYYFNVSLVIFAQIVYLSKRNRLKIYKY